MVMRMWHYVYDNKTCLCPFGELLSSIYVYVILAITFNSPVAYRGRSINCLVLFSFRGSTFDPGLINAAHLSQPFMPRAQGI